MLKVEWTHPALADLIEAQNFIARENPDAENDIATKVWKVSKEPGENPEIGRAGHVDGTREWVVGQTPYLIIYRINKNRVEILRVWHSKQNRQS